jgi:hypothetical protein
MRGVAYDDKFLALYLKRMKYFGKDYLYMSQETLRKWLVMEGLDISIRTLNRKLSTLRKRMILTSQSRTKRNPMGGMIFATTLQYIGWMGFHRLYTMGLMTWKEIKAWTNKPKPFHAHQTSEQKKGLTPADKEFYKDAKNIGDILESPG